jgi:tetratricopeptide (TPR) repeat protein
MRSVVALALGFALALPLPAAAEPENVPPLELQNPEAIEHFNRAQAHFEAADFAKAAPELKAAYAIEPNPRLLYAWAQAERFSGNCKKAVPLYEIYIETVPDGEGRRAAEKNIRECSGEKKHAEPKPVDPSPEDDPPKDEPRDDDAGFKPAYRDWLGATFVSLGVATGIVGGVLLAVGRQEVGEAPGAPTEDAYFDEVAAGRTKETAGIVLLSVGGALILAAVVRYAVLGAKNRKRRKAQTSLVVPERGFGLGLGVRF